MTYFQDAQVFKLDLVLPSAFTALGLALSGLRDFEGAHAALDEALALAKRSTDNYAQQNAYASRMRVFAQERRFAEACAVEPPTLNSVRYPACKARLPQLGASSWLAR